MSGKGSFGSLEKFVAGWVGVMGSLGKWVKGLKITHSTNSNCCGAPVHLLWCPCAFAVVPLCISCGALAIVPRTVLHFPHRDALNQRKVDVPLQEWSSRTGFSSHFTHYSSSRSKQNDSLVSKLQIHPQVRFPHSSIIFLKCMGDLLHQVSTITFGPHLGPGAPFQCWFYMRGLRRSYHYWGRTGERMFIVTGELHREFLLYGCEWGAQVFGRYCSFHVHILLTLYMIYTQYLVQKLSHVHVLYASFF